MEYFERLSDLYGLACIEQDMGICSANGDRLDEFIEIFISHIEEDPWEWEELAELVFESANDVILSKGLNETQENNIVQLVVDHKDKFPVALSYWLGLNVKEYPIKKLIESGNL